MQEYIWFVKNEALDVLVKPDMKQYLQPYLKSVAQPIDFLFFASRRLGDKQIQIVCGARIHVAQ